MIVALIDADILVYQAATLAEKPVDWGDGLWTLHAFEEEAQALFQASLTKILDGVNTDDFVLAFTDTHNFRKDVLPTYKSNRSGVRKPMLLKFLRDWATTQWGSKVMAGLEGDDVLGITATDKLFEDTLYIICTIDKDLRTIPAAHYNFGKDESFLISTAEADRFHMIQTLTGDTTDGYKGCQGVGIKTAEKILDGKVGYEMWEAVVKAYEKAGLSEEEALVQAQVARILRASDYNFETNEVILWQPQLLQLLA
jgi:DNA polymerase-1